VKECDLQDMVYFIMNNRKADELDVLQMCYEKYLGKCSRKAIEEVVGYVYHKLGRRECPKSIIQHTMNNSDLPIELLS